MTEPSTGWNQTPQPAPKKQGSGIAKGCLISAVIVVVLGVILIVALAFAVSDSADKAQKRLQTTTPSGEQVVISLDEFNRIETGMTLVQVEEIIGGPGKVASSSEAGTGGPLVNYQWGGEELGANAVIGVRGDTVVAKTQIGLT